MKISTIIVGSLETNCYIVTIKNQTIIIDPGADEERIVEATKGLNVIGVVITHYHFDHIGALKRIVEHYDVPVYDITNLTQGINNISDINFEVIYTPGHKSDSITLYFEAESVMFVGDFIFFENIGRTDLETGNYEDMIKSIRKIKTYPQNITIYPGHGQPTTLKHECDNNLYFKN